MAFDPRLPANRLIFEVRRKKELFQDFPAKLEQLMAEYGLSEAEREAFRAEDLKALRDLGVHPYFLPQVTRLLHGSAKNDSNSAAAQAYKRMMVERD